MKNYILYFLILFVTSKSFAQKAFTKNIENEILSNEEYILQIDYCLKKTYDTTECPFCNCNSLDTLKSFLNIKREYKIDIFVNTDYRGTKKKNFKYSRRIAKVIESYLINGGIDAKRITSTGLGENNGYVFKKDTVINNVTFKMGTLINEALIKNIDSVELKELIMGLNRRIVIKFIF